MRTILIPVVLLATLAGCSSSDDDAASTNSGSDVVPPMPNDPSVVPVIEPEPVEPEAGEAELPDDPSTSAISIDGHVELLRNVFAVYSAKLYGDEVLSAPGYSRPLFDGVPELDRNGNPVTPLVVEVCSNGGTASIVAQSTGFGIDDIVSWDFNFDNCQDGTALLDGQIKRQVFEEITVTSSGFTRDEQTRVTSFSGEFFRMIIGSLQSAAYFTATDDMDFSLSGALGSLVIAEANSELNTSDNGGVMRGGFVVQADWTRGQPITVRVTDDLVDDREFSEASRPVRFRTGQLELSDASGNQLVLQANTGDIDTVEITVTAGGSSETFVAPWQPWQDAFLFVSESGY